MKFYRTGWPGQGPGYIAAGYWWNHSLTTVTGDMNAILQAGPAADIASTAAINDFTPVNEPDLLGCIAITQAVLPALISIRHHIQLSVKIYTCDFLVEPSCDASVLLG